MTDKQPQVLIVGAGPVGLTAALALARAGITVRVVDSGEDIDRRMRASTFHPPTLDMLDQLGLGQDLISVGIKVPQWQMRQHESGQYVTFDLGLISDQTAHPYRLQVEQHRYCDLAVVALASYDVSIEFGTGVASLKQDTGGVETVLHNGNRISAGWVVGADGAASTVRQSLGLKYGGMTYTHSSVLVSTTFPFHEHLEGIKNVTYCWSERGPFSLLRLRQLWRASLYPGVEDLTVAAQESRVRDWLAYICPPARDASLMDIHPYRVHERCVEQFVVGRVLLAGDAAHLNPPSGGMGMNGGIHDAMNMADKLTRVIAGEDPTLLKRYDRQRRHVVAKRVIPQASANRQRMATKDRPTQLKRLAQQQQMANDPAQCRAFLLRASMIDGLREAEHIG
ncbi:MAG: FAD-dependent oxidoreductase [Lysobacterales bacterium]